MPGVELDAVASVGEDFGDQSFELDQLFFSHGYLQVDGLARPLGSVGLGVRASLAMQKRNPLQSLGPAAALCGTVRLLPIDLVPVGF